MSATRLPSVRLIETVKVDFPRSLARSLARALPSSLFTSQSVITSLTSSLARSLAAANLNTLVLGWASELAIVNPGRLVSGNHAQLGGRTRTTGWPTDRPTDLAVYVCKQFPLPGQVPAAEGGELSGRRTRTYVQQQRPSLVGGAASMSSFYDGKIFRTTCMSE